jgi:hypothetical protein
VLSFGESFGDGDVPGKRDPVKRIDAINTRELTDAGVPFKEGLPKLLGPIEWMIATERKFGQMREEVSQIDRGIPSRVEVEIHEPDCLVTDQNLLGVEIAM